MAAAAPVDLSRYTSAAAVVTETFKGTNGRTIIHIQDPHSNLSGQKSLAAAVRDIAARGEIRLIMVEGSARDASLDEIRDLASPPTWSIIARRLLYEGDISGEEYVSLTTELPIKIMGIEYQDQYERQVRAYSSLAARRGRALEYLREIRRAVESLKDRLYPKRLTQFERRIRANYHAEGDPSLRLLELLTLAEEAGVPWSDFSLISKFVKIREVQLEQKLQDWADLFGANFWDEADHLEDRIYSAMLPTEDLRTLRGIDQYIDLLTRAYGIRMSSDNMNTYRANRRRFPIAGVLAFLNRKLADAGDYESLISASDVLESAEGELRHFYGLAENRDTAFARNAAMIMAETGERSGILIAGGYHTDRLTRLWRAEGTSYMVLTPLVTDDADPGQYERLLLEQLKTFGSEAGDSASKQASAPGQQADTVRVSDAITAARLADFSPKMRRFINEQGPKDQPPLTDRISKAAARMADSRKQRSWKTPAGMYDRRDILRIFTRAAAVSMLPSGTPPLEAAIPRQESGLIREVPELKLGDLTEEQWCALAALWKEVSQTVDEIKRQSLSGVVGAPLSVDVNIRPRSRLTMLRLDTPAYLTPYEKFVRRYFGPEAGDGVLTPPAPGGVNHQLMPARILKDQPNLIFGPAQVEAALSAFENILKRIQLDIDRLVRERQDELAGEIKAAAARADAEDRDTGMYQAVKSYDDFVAHIERSGYARVTKGYRDLLNTMLIPAGYMIDESYHRIMLYRIIDIANRHPNGMGKPYTVYTLEFVQEFGQHGQIVFTSENLQWAGVDRSVLERREKERLSEWRKVQALLKASGGSVTLEYLNAIEAPPLSTWFPFYNALMYLERADRELKPDAGKDAKRLQRRADQLVRSMADYAIFLGLLRKEYPRINDAALTTIAIARVLMSRSDAHDALLFLSEIGQANGLVPDAFFTQGMNRIVMDLLPDVAVGFYESDMGGLIGAMLGESEEDSGQAKAWRTFVESLTRIEQDWLREIQAVLKKSGSRLAAPAKNFDASGIPVLNSDPGGFVPGFTGKESEIAARFGRAHADRRSNRFYWMTSKGHYALVSVPVRRAARQNNQEDIPEDALETLLNAADQSASVHQAQPILYVMSARDAGSAFDESSRQTVAGIRAALTRSGRGAVLELPLTSDESSFGTAQQIRLRRALRDGYNIVLMLSADEVRRVYRVLRLQLDADEWEQLEALTVHSPVRPGSAEDGTTANFAIAAARGRYLAGLKHRQGGSRPDPVLPVDADPFAAWLLKGITRPILEALMTVPTDIEEIQFYETLDRAAYEARRMPGYLADLRRALSAARLSA